MTTESSSRTDPAARAVRYAPVAAVMAAVIASFLSAGTAIYVSVNQANRADQHASSQAIRTDRQEAYTEFLAAMFGTLNELGGLQGALQTHKPAGAIGDQIQGYRRQAVEFFARAGILSMVGSDDVVNAVNDIIAPYEDFAPELLAFITRYLAIEAPGASDAAGWERDSTAMAGRIADLLKAQEASYTVLITEGREDLAR
ncbi:hypothetical protein AB0H71_32670 [Nocardia sp. NPDC050697]|uniref:hypothetical protein n=1 Tax=Nocardia sp. NPDC050697 TaxID=3155158 RepID=UPI0033E6AA61